MSPRTVEGHVPTVQTFLRYVSKPFAQIQVSDVRNYLAALSADSAPKTYNNHLGVLKRFFRDFLQRPDLVTTFKFAPINEQPITILPKAHLQRFYTGLEEEPTKYRLAFVLYTVSGVRRTELLTLNLENKDRAKRMITPNGHEGRTKHSWLSFYNSEAEQLLNQYLEETKINSGLQLNSTESGIRKAFKRAERRTGITVKPQMLREWFCNELGKLGVADRFVDELCGRLPPLGAGSTIQRLWPENLKTIYDRARLAVLS